ncbi:galactonate operon transcriptional repressor [Klebsiella pneumoniae]|nr:galactonate operon transcriptional repressor [Klebsiella pneumoniae]
MKQVTFAPRHHQLTNINTWTPDSQWLVFDVRPSGASFTGETIERVNVNSGTVETIYRATQGAHVGVVTVHPTQERYVFIHGPERPDAQWQYDFHHRRGVVAFQGAVENLDAMDITPPYTPGALRGGSHVHVYSPNGQFVSFTYNDHLLHERDPALDLRNVGVAAPYGPVTPQGQHPREYGGSHWCVLVSRTTPAPAPGSDEINRAYEEGWVGNHTLAFIGDTLAEIESALNDMIANNQNRDAFNEADIRYHEAVLQSVHNPVLQQLSVAISSLQRAVFERTWMGDEGNMPKTLQEHKALFDAIRHQDSNAAEQAALTMIASSTRRLKEIT